MKKFIIMLAAVIVFFSFNTYAADADNITVKIDGETIQFDTPPTIIDGRTLVPVGKIAEAMGAEVVWNAEEQEVALYGDGVTVFLVIGDNEAFRQIQDVIYVINLETPALIINNRTMVPARFVAEAFDCDVTWHGATKTINIITAGNSENASDAPIEGTTPGNIVKDFDADPTDYDAYLTPAYRNGTVGQCTWYAANRFNEVHNNTLIPPRMAIAKEWLDAAEDYPKLQVIRDVYDIRANSVAVFRNTKDPDALGHVEFIEYVERDSKGIPTYIYFTDANGVTTITYNQFDYGGDGIVQKKTFEKLLDSNGMELLGYIVPK